ncbi:MAG: histidine kinase N-terminal 7TM domain-containing diguanylate cyclase [Armatimonadota bacterium]
MPKEVMIISILLIVSGTIAGIVGLHTLSWRFRAITTAYGALMLSIAIYSIGYGFELNSNSLNNKLFWLDVQYLGISFLPAFWNIMAIQYVGREKWLNKYTLFLLFLIPVITLLLHYTDAYHHLHYGPASIIHNGPFEIISFAKGPFYWVYVVYVNLSILFGNILFFDFWRRSVAMYRKQITVMFIASIFPWISHLFYVTGNSIYGLDLAPFALLVSTLIYWYGLRSYHLFDLIPIARETILDVITDSILVLDMNDRIIDYNTIAKKMFNNLSEDVMGSNVFDVFGEYPAIIEAIKQTDVKKSQIRIEKDDVAYFYTITINPILKEKSKQLGRIILFHDISDHIELMDTLHTTAIRDDLTGVFKRGYFLTATKDALEKASKRKVPVSIIVIDLDLFKLVNDTYGHKAGDTALKAVADVLISTLRENDILGRFGGEEFVIFLPHTTPKAAAQVAERLRIAIQNTKVNIGIIDIDVRASFGVAGVDSTKTVNFDQLFANADRALYAAKNTGRNRVVVSEENIPPPDSASIMTQTVNL